MRINTDFIRKCVGLQDIKITYVNINKGIFEIFATSAFDFANCPKCGQLTQQPHDKRYQSYEHLPIWGLKTVIILEIKRYKCSCDPEHPFDENFKFIRKYQRRTIPFEEYIFNLAHKNTIQNIAELIGISHNACQRIYNYYAKQKLATKKPKKLELLGIDDIAVKKGHNYNTVIYNQETGSSIDVIEGRTKKDVLDYFKTLPQEVKDQIKAVSMDMSKGYCAAVSESFSNAKVVIDRFHITKNLHDKVDEIRRKIQNKAKKENNKAKTFNIRWALLKKVENLTGKELSNLLLAFEEYPVLEKLHYLKEEFSKFFTIKSKEAAHAFIDYFKELVKEYEIVELESFSNTLNNWLEEILNYYDYQISNGLIEGNNHKIKNIKRRGYGYRNQDNFNLRVKLEFAFK
ncbi:ISL3 family transposase [Fuchsiella alkaliacetigena]|uniref:ISL3 family transposase n=1 Tax=Fuchsiella alkaliacetigena TaxID=957042 RepID=UPI00200B2B88|nr:ISL3 family transposase [Fuchsiella alkaliacetigena]MCK8825512.1 ISL3 family transposase [Fuchsiella alkaliacetigena]